MTVLGPWILGIPEGLKFNVNHLPSEETHKAQLVKQKYIFENGKSEYISG